MDAPPEFHPRLTGHTQVGRPHSLRPRGSVPSIVRRGQSPQSVRRGRPLRRAEGTVPHSPQWPHDRCRDARRGSRRARGRRRRGRAHTHERPRRDEARVGGVPARGRMDLHRHRPVRLAPAAGEPDRRADGRDGLRLAPGRARGRELAAGVHVRARDGRPVRRRVPASRHELPDRLARAGDRSQARDRRVPDLPAGVRPGAVLRRPARAPLRRLPGEPAADRPRRDAGGRRARVRRPPLREPVRRRADPRGAALAPQRRVRAPPAHAGVRERAGRVPGRHRGPGQRDRDRPRRSRS